MKGNNQTFWGIWDPGSGLTVMPGDTKQHWVVHQSEENIESDDQWCLSIDPFHHGL